MLGWTSLEIAEVHSYISAAHPRILVAIFAVRRSGFSEATQDWLKPQLCLSSRLGSACLTFGIVRAAAEGG